MTTAAPTHGPNQARHTHVADGTTVGFFTDPSLCIGCKACEVACKEWNQIPEGPFQWTGDSYDNTGSLDASTWRHVKFVELDHSLKGAFPPGAESDRMAVDWIFLSDVCKHCANAGCLEACPTGAIVRTEIDSVFVQDDVCNGCGYCVVTCPFGVIDRRPVPMPNSGGAFKCTFCYDRQIDGLPPACAKTCPTESILFGPLEELHLRAGRRAAELKQQGWPNVSVYDASTGSVGGAHALFLIPESPEAFGLPPNPESPTVHLRAAWFSALWTSLALVAAVIVAFSISGT